MEYLNIKVFVFYLIQNLVELNFSCPKKFANPYYHVNVTLGSRSVNADLTQSNHMDTNND
jgi:hypothetical protein